MVSLEANQSITIGQDVEPLGVSLRVRQPRAALTDARVIPLIGRREAGEWAVGLSGFGVATRAIVFALLGWGIVVANWFRDASEVGTTASSVRILAHNREGWAARFSA